MVQMDFELVSNSYKRVTIGDRISDLVNRNYSCDRGAACLGNVYD